jgi:tryptophan-rich sensory protein
MDFRALRLAVALCAAVAVLEAVLGAQGLDSWYADLEKPAWHVPLAVFVLVAVFVYLMDGFVAYRLLTVPLAASDRVVGLTALGVVMVFNAMWNVALFRTQDLRIGLLGLIAFLAPLAILQVALVCYDKKAAIVNSAYVAWVVLYDIPLYFTMWRLNA